MERKRQLLRLGVATLIATACILPTGVQAAELRYGSDQCFIRTYNKAHLAKNPAQQVTQIRFVHRPSAYNFDEAALSQGQGGRVKEQVALVDVRFRNQRRLKQTVYCTNESGARLCGVECDGGRFAYRFKPNGSMLIDLRKTGGMLLGSFCGEESADQSHWFGTNKDDQLFRLDPADMSACSDLQ
ncbi:hypothetical protein [Cohaesibacter gelatinilyticus]|uniref:Uncharacterized protein n=1 Tax=Cohaesibacter gelatinilyticus TaxID=372072 RepID=A0A285PGM6_9HYPH|nr:hypothetical protein [Cohaesibacter gelatinilyticus]SNZ20849.1 hypothetical protein SAMN06265368_3960 [Cohaesibacter gelatinilyticus]